MARGRSGLARRVETLLDDGPVDCVILLAMSEADRQNTHMRVFSTLARRLMHERFREGVRTADDAGALHAFMAAELETAPRDDTVS